MQYVYFGLAGLLVGGMLAMRQQKRPIWVLLLFGLFAGLFLWFGLMEG